MSLVIFRDQFNAPNGTKLENRTPNIGTGWHRHKSYGTSGTVETDCWLLTSDTPDLVYLADHSNTPYKIKIRLDLLASDTGRVGVVMRADDPTCAPTGLHKPTGLAANYYAFTYEKSVGFRLWKRELNSSGAWVETVLDTSVPAVALGDGTYWLTLEANGSTLIGHVQNNPGDWLQQNGTWGSYSPLGCVNAIDTDFSTGKAGIYVNESPLSSPCVQGYSNINEVEIERS